jgi:hypothetical protein
MTRPHEGFFSWFDLGGAEHAWGELSFARDISIAGRLDEPPVLRRLGQNRSRRGENGLADRQAGCIAADEWLERVSSLGCR